MSTVQTRSVESGSHGEPGARHTGDAHVMDGGCVPSGSHAPSASSSSACVSGSPRSTASAKRAKNADMGPVRSAETSGAATSSSSVSTTGSLPVATPFPIAPETKKRERERAVRPSQNTPVLPSGLPSSSRSLHFVLSLFRDCPRHCARTTRTGRAHEPADHLLREPRVHCARPGVPPDRAQAAGAPARPHAARHDVPADHAPVHAHPVCLAFAIPLSSSHCMSHHCCACAGP